MTKRFSRVFFCLMRQKDMLWNLLQAKLCRPSKLLTIFVTSNNFKFNVGDSKTRDSDVTMSRNLRPQDSAFLWKILQCKVYGNV